MTCQGIRDMAEAYARGTLGAGEAAAFEAHLAECPSCEAALLALAGPPDGLAQLPRSLEPAADLWPAIHDAIARRHDRRIRVPGWALAAAAVTLMVLSSGVTALVLRSRPAAPVVASDVSALEAQYAEASEDLAGALEAARGRLGPETMATIERNLRVIDTALDETRRALANDPGNAILAAMVVATWKQKVDLLRRATTLGAES